MEEFYDKEKDKDTLDKLETSKNVTLLGLSRLIKIISWILWFYSIAVAFLTWTIALIWVVVPLTIVTVVICIAIISIYMAFYLPGVLIATIMTFFDPEMETRTNDTIITIITRIVLNGSLGWIYVEKKLFGTTYSMTFLT